MHRKLGIGLLALLLNASVGAGELPAFTLKRLDGSLFKSLDHVGKQVIVIDFWATWCGPCKLLLKKLQELKTKHLEVLVLAVSIDDGSSMAQVNQYVQSRGFTFTILLDPEASLCRIVNPSNGVPFTVVIDKKGRITFTHTGFLPGDEKVLFEKVEELLR